MAKQFIIPQSEMKEEKNGLICISCSEVKHIHVLRYNVGDSIKINNKIYEIVKMTNKEVYLKFLEDIKMTRKSKVNVTLYLACLKNEMMDLAVKKVVELGIDKIQPFYCRNVVVKLDKEKEEKRLEKLSKIAIEAVKQCGRDDIPEMLSFEKIENIDFNDNDINILAFEKEEKSLKSVIQNIDKSGIKTVGIIIGPEGGFEKEEVEKILNFKNVKSVSLGSRILRAETAAISLLSVINYEFEN